MERKTYTLSDELDAVGLNYSPEVKGVRVLGSVDAFKESYVALIKQLKESNATYGADIYSTGGEVFFENSFPSMNLSYAQIEDLEKELEGMGSTVEASFSTDGLHKLWFSLPVVNDPKESKEWSDDQYVALGLLIGYCVNGFGSV